MPRCKWFLCAFIDLANLSQVPAISATACANENGPGNPGPLVEGLAKLALQLRRSLREKLRS
jgi:hypothetical protein